MEGRKGNIALTTIFCKVSDINRLTYFASGDDITVHILMGFSTVQVNGRYDEEMVGSCGILCFQFGNRK